MKIFEILCLIFVVVEFSDGLPRSRYYPRTYMVGGSFYANPRYVRQGPGYEYIPPGQMTTMVLGDTVATNTFSGSPPAVLTIPKTEIGQVDIEEYENTEQVTEKHQQFFVPVQEPDLTNETEPEEEILVGPGGEQETLFTLEEATTETVVSTTRAAPPSRAPSAGRKIKTIKAKKPTTAAPPKLTEEDEEEDDVGLSATWPFGGAGKAGFPNYNAFFPVFIGGSSLGRSRTRSPDSQDDGYPGAATAIANSFSTGKGGVATSHATSFGDPLAAAMFRNAGLANFWKKSTKKQPVLEEDD